GQVQGDLPRRPRRQHRGVLTAVGPDEERALGSTERKIAGAAVHAPRGRGTSSWFDGTENRRRSRPRSSGARNELLVGRKKRSPAQPSTLLGCEGRAPGWAEQKVAGAAVHAPRRRG